MEPKETPSCLIPRLLVILSQILKELVIKILEMILRFYTYVIPSFKIDGIRSSPSPNQLHPVLVTIFLVLYAKNEVAAKIARVYMPMLWVIPEMTPI